MEWAFLYLFLLGLFSGIISAGIDYTIEFFKKCTTHTTTRPHRVCPVLRLIMIAAVQIIDSSRVSAMSM